MQSNLSILHAAPIRSKKVTGPSFSVPRLVSAQNRIEGVQAAIVITSKDYNIPKTNGELRYFYPHYHTTWPWTLTFNRLNPPYNNPSLVVVHSTYVFSNFKIISECLKKKIPYIFTPRGGLTKGAQRIKSFKKHIANMFFLNYAVQKSKGVHFLTRGEANVSFIYNKPYFIIGNGTDIPDSMYVSTPGKLKGLNFIYIGRLDIHTKGLDVLIEALSKIKKQLISNGVKIRLHGTDHLNSRENLTKRIFQRGLGSIVTLPGAVFGENKSKVLSKADLFLHTSRFEGHPQAVMEALSHGVPCLLTPGTNVSDEISFYGAGWKVDLCQKSIASRLLKVINNRDSLEIAGNKARTYALKNCNWDDIAVKTVKGYIGLSR